jgi:hypothetical protein
MLIDFLFFFRCFQRKFSGVFSASGRGGVVLFILQPRP